MDSWQWKVGDTTASQCITRSGVHTNYCVLAVPAEPWYKSVNTHPWASALDIACRRVLWAGGATDTGEAATKITRAIYGASVFEYWSACNYSDADAPILNLTQCIERLKGSAGKGPQVNCLDCANFVVTFGNLVAPKLYTLTMGKGQNYPFDTNPFCAIGMAPWTPPPGGWRFSYHVVAVENKSVDAYGDLVYDACLKVDNDTNPLISSPGHTMYLPTGLKFSDEVNLGYPYVWYDECLAAPGENGYDRCWPNKDSRTVSPIQ